MKSQTSVSHLTIPPELAPTLEWNIAVNGEYLDPDDTMVKDWQYFLDLDISVHGRCDVDAVLEAVGLPPTAILRFVLTARSSAPGVIASQPVRLRDEFAAGLHVPGSMLGGTLELTGVIATDVVPDGAEPLAPRRQGHWLYRTSRRLTLEGDAPRLPLLPVSFEDQGIEDASHSLWWLNILDHELERPTNDCLWLWVNTDSPVIQKMLEKPSDPTSRVWSKVLQLDFVRELLNLAMGEDHLDLDITYPEGSLGSTLAGVVRLLSTSLEDLRLRHQSDPGRLEAELQGKVLSSITGRDEA